MLLLEAADWAIVGQQVKHHHDYMMLISSIRFTSGFCYEDSGWLTLDAKWLVLGTSVGNQGCTLSQYVHNVDNKPGLITKVLSYYRSCSISGSSILGCSMYLLSCPLSLCIHGNSCSYGQLPAIEQCLIGLESDHNHCEAHMSVSILFISMRVKSSIWSTSNIFPELMSLLGGLLLWTLWWIFKASCSGPIRVLNVELLLLPLVSTVFDNLS